MLEATNNANTVRASYFKRMNLFKLHSDLAERLRIKLGWSHYAIYWVSFIKGVAVTCLVLWLMY